MAGAQGCGEGKIAGLYDLERTLGKGHFAVVKLARHVFTGQRVAVKVIDKSKLAGEAAGQLLQEVRCMKLVQHPNVVRLYEVIDTHAKLYLILELGDGGDMFDHIMRHEGGLSEARAKHYFAQIVHAISYCHKLHVVHRDLKPENVVFFQEQGVVKLTDFGFSNRFQPGKMLTTSCGSLAYSAPEILLGDEYDAPAVGKGGGTPLRVGTCLLHVPCLEGGPARFWETRSGSTSLLAPYVGSTHALVALLSPQGGILSLGAQPCPGTGWFSLPRPSLRPQSDGSCQGGQKAQAGCEPGVASAGAREEQCEGAVAGELALAVISGGDAGRKPARDAGVWVEELRKFPLHRPRPGNRFLSVAPSALPPLDGVLGGRGDHPRGAGSRAGGTEWLCWDRGDVGGKRDPSQLCWNLGQEDLAKQNTIP